MSDHDAPPADPKELDFTDDENVVEIGEGRYVVGTNGRPKVPRSQPDPAPDDGGGFAPADPTNPGEQRPPGPGGGQPPAGGSTQPAGAQPVSPQAQGGHAAPAVDRQSVSRWLASSFDGDGFAYGIDATLHANGDTTRQRMVSNDVTATFDSLVTWFASNAGPNSPTPEALGLLLVAAETTVDVPPVAIKRFAASQGLTASDSIGDLVRAAEDAGGFRIE